MTDLLINGLPRRDIDSRDRGMQYGDGFFTTIRVVKGKPQLWQQHMLRLEKTSAYLAITIPEPAKLLAETRQVSRGHADCAVRLTFTRGVGGRGYGLPESGSATRLVSRSNVPSHYSAWRETGIRLEVANQRLGNQPMLAGLKTLNRLEQVLLKKEQQERKADDLLVLDTQQHVCETTTANIFWRQGENWYTPLIESSGVAGVVRAELLQNNRVNRGNYSLDDLRSADEAFICNALLGLVPVQSIADYQLPVVRSYPLQLETALNEVNKPE